MREANPRGIVCIRSIPSFVTSTISPVCTPAFPSGVVTFGWITTVIPARNGSSGNFQAAGIDAGYRGKGLQVEFTVEDPNVFRMPWSGAATYRKSDGTWVENVCAENLHEYYSNRDTQAPQAGKPDF